MPNEFDLKDSKTGKTFTVRSEKEELSQQEINDHILNFRQETQAREEALDKAEVPMDALDHAWEIANAPVSDMIFGKGAVANKARQADELITNSAQDGGWLTKARAGLSGFNRGLVENVDAMASPLAAIMALAPGGAGVNATAKAALAAKNTGRAGQAIAKLALRDTGKAGNLVSKLSRPINYVEKAADVGFGVEGAIQGGDQITRGLENDNYWDIAQGLAGASGTASLGTGRVGRSFDAANAPLQQLPDRMLQPIARPLTNMMESKVAPLMGTAAGYIVGGTMGSPYVGAAIGGGIGKVAGRPLRELYDSRFARYETPREGAALPYSQTTSDPNLVRPIDRADGIYTEDTAPKFEYAGDQPPVFEGDPVSISDLANDPRISTDLNDPAQATTVGNVNEFADPPSPEIIALSDRARTITDQQEPGQSRLDPSVEPPPIFSPEAMQIADPSVQAGMPLRDENGTLLPMKDVRQMVKNKTIDAKWLQAQKQAWGIGKKEKKAPAPEKGKSLKVLRPPDLIDPTAPTPQTTTAPVVPENVPQNVPDAPTMQSGAYLGKDAATIQREDIPQDWIDSDDERLATKANMIDDVIANRNFKLEKKNATDESRAQAIKDADAQLKEIFAGNFNQGSLNVAREPLNKPINAYHGTDREFDSFDRNALPSTINENWMPGHRGLGTFFAPDAESARVYPKDKTKARVIASELSFENPIEIHPTEFYTNPPSRADLIAKGHDGIIVGEKGRVLEYVALHPERQAKIKPDMYSAREPLNKFSKLADDQRGKPESAMLAVQKHGGSQIYGNLTEHVGDLTHRMSEPVAQAHGTFGYSYVKTKVENALRTLENDYGFDRELNEQLSSNLEFAKKYQYPDSVKYATPEQGLAELKALGKLYAAEHMKLEPINRVQRLGRLAAVEIGRFEFDRAKSTLRALKSELDKGEAHWAKVASEGLETNGGLYSATLGDQVLPTKRKKEDYIEQPARLADDPIFGFDAEETLTGVSKLLEEWDTGDPTNTQIKARTLMRELSDEHGLDVDYHSNTIGGKKHGPSGESIDELKHQLITHAALASIAKRYPAVQKYLKNNNFVIRIAPGQYETHTYAGRQWTAAGRYSQASRTVNISTETFSSLKSTADADTQALNKAKLRKRHVETIMHEVAGHAGLDAFFASLSEITIINGSGATKLSHIEDIDDIDLEKTRNDLMMGTMIEDPVTPYAESYEKDPDGRKHHTVQNTERNPVGGLGRRKDGRSILSNIRVHETFAEMMTNTAALRDPELAAMEKLYGRPLLLSAYNDIMRILTNPDVDPGRLK